MQGGKDMTRLMTFIDDDGLENEDNPANKWKKVADWTDDGTKYVR